MYSDAHVTTEITTGCGPYQILNTIGGLDQPSCVPVAVLRSTYHRSPGENDYPDMKNTDVTNYLVETSRRKYRH